MAAPDNVQAMVLNSTVAEILWDPVPSKLLRGHLKGFKVQKTFPNPVLQGPKFSRVFCLIGQTTAFTAGNTGNSAFTRQD